MPSRSSALTRDGTLKAGEYRFDHPVPPGEVYNRLVQGDVFTQALTIPEGYNIFDIATAVEAAGFARRDDFLAAERQHTELVADLLPPDTHIPSRSKATCFQILTASPGTRHPSRCSPPWCTASVRSARSLDSIAGTRPARW